MLDVRIECTATSFCLMQSFRQAHEEHTAQPLPVSSRSQATVQMEQSTQPALGSAGLGRTATHMAELDRPGFSAPGSAVPGRTSPHMAELDCPAFAAPGFAALDRTPYPVARLDRPISSAQGSAALGRTPPHVAEADRSVIASAHTWGREMLRGSSTATIIIIIAIITITITGIICCHEFPRCS